TLDAIARRERVPVVLLARLNHLGPGDRIVAGQRLHVARSVPARYRRVLRRRRLYASRHIPASRRMTYRVRKGDTVYSIARQFQVTMQELRDWNGLKQRRLIRAGQRLVLYVPPNRQEG
ncbi:MAG TPA: LysM peptidoglycan-binding domain-containing protein, partial [Steroidobacteraceae bacterium]|nr:LysM peptidoglycan-binding domain-containing protein [Steroidobacteraceae bacterium]